MKARLPPRLHFPIRYREMCFHLKRIKGRPINIFTLFLEKKNLYHRNWSYMHINFETASLPPLQFVSLKLKIRNFAAYTMYSLKQNFTAGF
jgi:hypothetical protein